MANVMKQGYSNTRPSDVYVVRNRLLRVIVLVLFSVLAPVIMLSIMNMLASRFYGSGSMMSYIGGTIGFALGSFIVISSIERYFIIRNSLTGFLVTQNALASLFGRDPNVHYGPGVHICYPWEIRSQKGNILVEEVSNPLTFTIQCVDGVVEGVGSYRLRPDMDRPMEFLTGVASAESELQDLIINEVRKVFSKKSVFKALTETKQIDARLKKFMEHDSKLGTQTRSEFEERFGIEIGDITFKEILPSVELSRTISSIAEAIAIFNGTAQLLGRTPEQARTELENGTIAAGDWANARDRFMSVSGNLEGMEIKRQEFDLNVHGLDEKAIGPIAEIFRDPAIRSFLMGATQGGGKKATPRAKQPVSIKNVNRRKNRQ